MPDPEEERRRRQVSVPVDETIELRRLMRDNWELPFSYDGQVTGSRVVKKWIDLLGGFLDYCNGRQTKTEFPKKCADYLDAIYFYNPRSAKVELSKEKVEAAHRALKALTGGDQERKEMLEEDLEAIKEIWHLSLLHRMLFPSSKAAEIFPETPIFLP